MSQHAKFSPSGSSRWLACPGSIWLSEKAPAQTSSFAAEEGTDAHSWASKMLLGDDGIDNPYKGIQLYVDRVLASAQRKGAKMWVEERVYLTDEIHGTPDAIVFHKKVLEVFDLKYGYNKVEAQGNTQMIIYAGAAIKTYNLNPNKVVLNIVQPRAGGVRTSVLPRKTFDALLNAITEKAEQIKGNPSAPRKAGEHCQYCAAATICPERKDEATLAAEIAFRSVEEIDEQTLLFAIENKKRIIDWFDQLNKFAIERPPTGYKVVQGQGKRVWRTDIPIPMVLKAMTLSEAEKAGHNLDELTFKKPGPPTLVRKEFQSDEFSEL